MGYDQKRRIKLDTHSPWVNDSHSSLEVELRGFLCTWGHVKYSMFFSLISSDMRSDTEIIWQKVHYNKPL